MRAFGVGRGSATHPRAPLHAIQRRERRELQGRTAGSEHDRHAIRARSGLCDAIFGSRGPLQRHSSNDAARYRRPAPDQSDLAFLYFVSPSQVNFLVPSTLTPGPVDIELSLDGRYGEAVRVQLAEFSPALFPLDPETVLATRADGSVISYDKPARPGEIVILYATGLGATKPRVPAGQIPTGIAWLDKLADFRLTLAGETVDRANLLYAGAAPGFAGLYQINLRLPENVGRNPELRIGFKETMSPADARLPVERGNP